MRRAILFVVMVGCGGATHHAQVQEVPIDQGGRTSSELPPDEVGGDGGVTTSTYVMPDANAPPGVGPQSLDTTQQDAGAQAQTVAFVQRQGGLTEKECTDAVMVLAKLTSKETHAATPTQADLAQHPVFGLKLSACGNAATKKQQKCAMASKSTAAWKKCME